MRKWMRAVHVLALGTLLTLVAACGGGGGGGEGDAAAAAPGPTATVEAPAAPAAPAPAVARNVLFVSDGRQGVVGLYPDLNPSRPYAMDPATSLRAAGNYPDVPLAYDSGRDLLYVGAGTALKVYAAAKSMDHTASATRTITMPGDMKVTAIFLDEAQDAVYVGVSGAHERRILLLRNASTASGAAAPAISMTVDGADSLAVDVARSLLYVTNSYQGVFVYTRLRDSPWLVPRDREVPGVRSARGVALDPARDRLYVTDVFTGVHVIANASTTGAREVATVAVGGSVVALDAANDRLYLGANDTAYVLDGASTLAGGTATPRPLVQMGTGRFISGFAFP